MDAFADVFRGMRARGWLFGSSTLSPPWALRFVDGAPLTLCAVVTGGGWIVPEHRPPEQGGTRHRRGWHDPGDTVDTSGATTLVVGAYPVRGEISLRLLDWMLVCTIREWFDRPGGEPPAWYTAQRDPVVGHALRLLHAEPAASWTVSSLAGRSGVSRATLAERFVDLVGEPPMTYLTRWRTTLAADLLVGPEAVTVAEVARAVGCSDAFGFSAALKRTRGGSRWRSGPQRVGGPMSRTKR